jgi:hypothetical protein
VYTVVNTDGIEAPLLINVVKDRWKFLRFCHFGPWGMFGDTILKVPGNFRKICLTFDDKRTSINNWVKSLPNKLPRIIYLLRTRMDAGLKATTLRIDNAPPDFLAYEYNCNQPAELTLKIQPNTVSYAWIWKRTDNQLPTENFYSEKWWICDFTPLTTKMLLDVNWSRYLLIINHTRF